MSALYLTQSKPQTEAMVTDMNMVMDMATDTVMAMVMAIMKKIRKEKV